MQKVEQWGIIELSFEGKSNGNPFTDYIIFADFVSPKEKKHVMGFYDGNGVYKIRFMPSFTGIYSYTTGGDYSEYSVNQGEFEVVSPISRNNHGMVHAADERYFKYSDGTPYYSVGTTCYAWVHQNEELQEQTLRTLSGSCFNKIRFCIFPKFYQYNETEPQMYPYVRGNKRGIDEERIKRLIVMTFHSDKKIEDVTDFDCYTFNVEMFRKFDRHIAALCDMGIEADLILMHPYDKWGFANMNMECNKLYLRYVTARFGAYRNVWWSMANEYDLTTKNTDEWEELADTVKKSDPYNHLISIHNCMAFYDFNKEWITHCSMQRQDFYKSVEFTSKYLDEYNKPVVWDEIAYEGNVSMGWGNISGEELARRFWETALRGGFAGHGETYVNENEILWWSHGGVLHGTSEPRLRFLKEIMENVPGTFLKQTSRMFDEVVGIPYKCDLKPVNPFIQPIIYADYELHYYSFGRPSYREFQFQEGACFQVDVIDTWNMTITDIGIHSGYTKVELPGREYMAIRLRRIV